MPPTHAVLLTTAVIASGLSAATGYLTRDVRPWFEARHRGLLSASPGVESMTGGCRVQSVRLVDASGLAVDVTWKRHAGDSARRLPVALILGGHLTGAAAVKLFGETPGVMVAAMSYPFDGDPRPSRLTFLKQIPRIRRAFLDTPPAMQLALDYLLSRADVDTSRVELIGVSLGAPFATITGALDPRPSRVWAVHGSGGSFAPLEASMRRSIKFKVLRYPAVAMAGVIIAGPRIAPERWVADIAPRPFVMVNASDDERMPLDAVRALYDAALQPKEQVWMSGKHVHGDAPTIERIAEIVLGRIRGDGPRAPAP